MVTVTNSNANKYLYGSSYVAPVLGKNPPGIVPQVYPGSTGSGSNQNVNTSAFGGYTPNPHDAPGYNPVTDPTSSAYRPTTISAGGSPSVLGASTSYAPQIPSTISSKSLTSSPSSSPLPSYSSYAPSTISSSPGGTSNYSFDSSTGLTPYLSGLGWKYENGAYVAPPEQAVAPADEKTGVSKFMQQFKDMINPKTSEADLYKQTYGVDINQAQADAARTRNELLSVTSQINDINATKNASLTSLLNVGAKEGVTTAVYGGQQAQFEREATIKLLPLQAQLATAQGAYEVAQGHLDNYFKAVTADNDANYKYQIDMFQWAYDRSDKADQAKITKKAQDLSDNKSYYTNLVSDIRTLAGDATNNGQGTLATNISKLITTLDPTSANFQSDYQNVLNKLASYQGQITPKATDGTSEDIRQGDYQMGLQFIKDNPNATPSEIEQSLRANTRLSEADIKSLTQNTKPFLSTNYFSSLFTDDQLKKAASDAGYRHLLTSWGTEKQNYLDSLMNSVNKYREAGYTDQEILKMMQ